MGINRLLINLGKLLLCAASYMVGLTLGGMLARALALQPPPMPEGLDASSAGLYLMLESPLWGLALLGLSRSIVGRFWMRALMLAWFTWVSNVLANQIEAAYFGTMATGFWFAIIAFLIPSLLVSAAVAWLFPPAATEPAIVPHTTSFFNRYSASSWIWRFSVGVVLFMPIYYLFGLLVIPFTIEYYRQGLYGLRVPPLDQLLVIMFVRSVLFFAACLPIVVAWHGARRHLAVCLGLALFYFVGFQPLVIANWMPWELRVPHMLEILADEVVYAWALVMLLRVKNNNRPPLLHNRMSGAPSRTQL
jgi:hypothetical protein